MNASRMNALVLHAVNVARHEQIPKPEPGPGQVRIRVGFCGVCNSDMARFFGKGPYSFPLVCGHEFAGLVDSVGAGVKTFARGDRVAVFPLLWCGQCGACERGQYTQCTDYDYLGSRSNGAFADYVVAPARNLLRVADRVSLEEAAMIEPAAVALHALRRTGRTMLGSSIAVFGAGPIGLMVAQWARAMGTAKVILIDLVAEKLDLARNCGFEHVLDLRTSDPVTAIETLTGGRGADVCVDAAGVPQASLQALRAVNHGGTVVLLGNPTGDVSLPAELISRLMRREVQIVGTWNSDYAAFGEDDDWHRALNAMASGTIDVKPLVTHRVPLEGAIEALQMMRDRTAFYCKVLVQPNPEEQRGE